MLQFGVYGVALALAWIAFQIIKREMEQRLPRRVIVTFAYCFLGFCVLVTLITASVQLSEKWLASRPLQHQIESLRESVNREQQTVSARDHSIEALNLRYQVVERDLLRVKDQLGDAEKKIAIYDAATNGKNDRVEEVTRLFTKELEEKTALRINLDEAKTQRDSNQTRLATATQEITALTISLNESRTRISGLEQSLETEKSAKARGEAQIKNITDEYEALKAAKTAGDSMVVDLRAGIEKLEKLTAERVAQINRQEIQIRELQRERDSIASKLKAVHDREAAEVARKKKADAEKAAAEKAARDHLRDIFGKGR